MIENVFNNLNKWRHLPAYQLERRADIFFSVYLRDVVEEFTGNDLEEIIVPELPIHRRLVSSDSVSNLSVKVDYALFSKDQSVVYFIELKTDMNSRRGPQDEYLKDVAKVGFNSVAKGLKDIVLATKSYQKYYHLISVFSQLGFMIIPDDIENYLYPKPKQGLTERLRKISVTEVNPRIEVIYLQPTSTNVDRCITFKQMAEHVSRYDDKMSKLFAASLLEWQGPAGMRTSKL